MTEEHEVVGYHNFNVRRRRLSPPSGLSKELASMLDEIAELRQKLAEAEAREAALRSAADNLLREEPDSSSGWILLRPRHLAPLRAALAALDDASPAVENDESNGIIFEHPKPTKICHGKVVSVHTRPPMVIEQTEEERKEAERIAAMERVCAAVAEYARASRDEEIQRFYGEQTWPELIAEGEILEAHDALAALNAAQGKDTGPKE